MSAEPATRGAAVGVFPFGRPVLPRPARIPDRPAAAVVLGVYPNALHVRWSRNGETIVGSLAVDNEPEVFWTADTTTAANARCGRAFGAKHALTPR